MKKVILLFVAVIMSVSMIAQRHELGVVAGGLNGISHKYWFSENLAVQTDLAIGLTVAPGAVYMNGTNYGSGSNPQYDFTLNPNVAYHFELADDFNLYAGGGLNFGLASNIANTNPNAINGKFGVNSVIGVAYALEPIVLAFDFRPGYGLSFKDNSTAHFSFFDWKLAVAVRYCF